MNPNKKKNKILDALETIVYLLGAMALAGLFLLGLWRMGIVGLIIVVLITVVIILLVLSIKKDEKRKREYDEKYKTSLIFKDSFFGETTFIKDSKKNELISKDFSMPFGNHETEIRITDYDENNHEFYFRDLEYLFRRADEILDRMQSGFIEWYADSQKVTVNELKENFVIDSISIEKYEEYFFFDMLFVDEDKDFDVNPGDLVMVIAGNLDNENMSLPQQPTIYINCKTKKLCYAMAE